MNLRHIPNHKTSKRVYQILFVATLTVLSSLFFTCDNANTTGGGTESDRTPAAPSNVRAAAGDGEITVIWEDPADTGILEGVKATITGFKIYYSKNPIDTAQDTPIEFTDLTQDRSVTIPGLTNGTSYNIAVSTVTGAGEGKLSAAVTAVPKALSDGPTELSIVSYGETEIELTWKEPADSITKYRVYYSKTPNIDTTIAAFAETQDGSTTALSVTSLDSGTPYYFKVTAFSDAGESAASSEVEAYTNGVPGEPSNIKAATTGAGEITVTWDEPSPGYYDGLAASVSYKVYHKTDSLAETDLDSLTPEDVNTGLSHVLTGLQEDSTYFVTVVAYNDIGDSTVPASVEATALGADRAPGAPTSVAIDSSTETGITLSWTAPTDTGLINGDSTPGTITAYSIYYSETQGFIIDGNTAKKEVDNTTPTTTASIDSLNSKTRYYFKVSAANDSGSGNASSEAEGYTLGRPGAPTNVKADPGTVADNEVTLTWEALVDTGIKDSTGTAGTITEYKVYYATSTINDVNAAGVESETSTGTSATITGLSAGTRYYFKVTAVNGIGEGTASLEADTYTNSLPGVPTDIQADPSVDALTVSWTAPSAAGYSGGNPGTLSYKLYHSTADITSVTDLTTLTETDASADTEATLSSLTGGTDYYLIVIANNGYGDSPRPTAISAIPWETNRVPGAPTSVTITSSTETGIVLSWTAPGDMGIINENGTPGTIIGYTVYYSKTNGFAIGDTGVTPQTTGNTNSISLTSLDSGTQYYFRVLATNETGPGAASDEVDGYTTSRPGVPTIAAADPGTTADSEVTLSWDAPDDKGIKDSTGAADTITAYKVYYSTSPITDVGGATGADAQGESHKITGLSAGTRYYFKVAALNGTGEGDSSVEADTYTNGVPDAPSNIQAATTAAGKITVTWDAPSPGYYDGSAASLSYKVYHKTDSLAAADLENLSPATVDTGLSYVLTGIQAGTYYVTVIAVNDFGSSAMPTSVEATAFEADRPPGAPTSVTIDSSTETGITLSWTAPGDMGIINGNGTPGIIKGYEVYYSKTPNFTIGDTEVTSQTATTTSFSFTSLDSGTQYYFKVTAANDSGSGNASIEATGYTLSRPGAPTNVAADPGTAADSEVTLTWDAPVDKGIEDSAGTEGTLSYKVYYAESTITDLNGGGVTGVDAQGTPHKITGLSAGTRYYFKVAAANGIGEETASVEADTYTNSLPSEPTSIQATPSVDSLTVSWTAPSAGYSGGNPGTLSYKLYHSTADITSVTDLTTLTETEVTSGTTATLSSLTGGTTYYLIVIANNGYGDSPRPASISAAAWEADRVPGVPTSVTIDSSTETGIVLTWMAPNDTGIESGAAGTIVGYTVYYSKTAGFAIGDTGVTPQTTGTTSFSFTSLDSGTQYYFRVLATNAKGSGNPSAETAGYTTSKAGAPTDLAAESGTTADNEVTLTWNAPAYKGITDSSGTPGSITGYRVYYLTSSFSDLGAAIRLDQPSTGTTETITGLTPGTQYYFRVTADNSTGEGAASVEADTYTNGVPDAPSNIQAATTAAGEITVTWNAPSPGYYDGSAASLSYKVYHKTDSLAEADLENLSPATVDTGLSYVLTGIQAGTYYVTVIAVNDFGSSAMPTSVEATAFEADRPPGAPTSVTIDSSTETGITLSWTAPGDMGIINGDGTSGTITGYEVYYSKTPNFAIADTGVKSQTTGTNSISFSSLDSGTQYYFKVSAANDSGSGVASAEVDGYTTSRGRVRQPTWPPIQALPPIAR